MARKPKYRRHSTRDLGFVEYAGKRMYFPGPWRSEESQAAYLAFLRSVGFTVESPGDAPANLPIAFLIVRYLAWAEDAYPGGTRSEYANVKASMTLLAAEFGELRAAELSPLKLKDFQQRLAKRGLSRGYINSTCSRVKRAFKWAVSEELIPVAVYHALATVPGLRKGRSVAAEPKKREPASWEHVELTLNELSPTVRAMVELQWLTGVRSQSLCRARVEQFDRSKQPWEWHPRHKGEHLDRSLLVYIGPQGQAILAPYLAGRKPKDFLFQPKHLSGKRAKGFRAFYDSVSYLRAIIRAIARVNRARADDGLPPIPHWTPHQLRHARGTLVREKHGLEAAQAALGHARIDATQIYAQKQLALAKLVAETMG